MTNKVQKINVVTQIFFLLHKTITEKRMKNRNLTTADEKYLVRSLNERLRLSPLKSDIRSVGQVPFLGAVNFAAKRLVARLKPFLA